MHNPIPIQRFERRLVELCCPPALIRARVLEMADHYDDLKNDALEEGLSEADAAALADQRLGEPVRLAEQLAEAVRRSSWWGRHPIIGFCLVPPFVILLLMVLEGLIEAGAGWLYFTPEEQRLLGDADVGLSLIRMLAAGTVYTAAGLTCTLLAFLASRSAAGLKWALVGCAVCAVHGYLFGVTVSPHMVNLAYHFGGDTDLISMLIPLLFVGLLWVRQRRRESILPEIPVPVRS